MIDMPKCINSFSIMHNKYFFLSTQNSFCLAKQIKTNKTSNQSDCFTTSVQSL